MTPTVEPPRMRVHAVPQPARAWTTAALRPASAAIPGRVGR